MKKIRNLVIGGIENKVFNLILAAVIITALVFMSGFIYQNKMLEQLSTESSEKQQESITGFIGQVMDQVVQQTMDRNTEQEAALADEMFHSLETRVRMMGDYAQKLFAEEDPENARPSVFTTPDPAATGTRSPFPAPAAASTSRTSAT